MASAKPTRKDGVASKPPPSHPEPARSSSNALFPQPPTRLKASSSSSSVMDKVARQNTAQHLCSSVPKISADSHGSFSVGFQQPSKPANLTGYNQPTVPYTLLSSSSSSSFNTNFSPPSYPVITPTTSTPPPNSAKNNSNHGTQNGFTLFSPYPSSNTHQQESGYCTGGHNETSPLNARSPQHSQSQQHANTNSCSKHAKSNTNGHLSTATSAALFPPPPLKHLHKPPKHPRKHGHASTAQQKKDGVAAVCGLVKVSV